MFLQILEGSVDDADESMDMENETKLLQVNIHSLCQRNAKIANCREQQRLMNIKKEIPSPNC